MFGSRSCSDPKKGRPDPDDEDAYPLYANDADPWQAHLAEIDALLDRTNQVLAGETPLRNHEQGAFHPLQLQA